MNERQRRAVIALALVGTMAAAVFAPPRSEDVAAPVGRSSQQVRSEAGGAEPATRPRRQQADAPPVFETRSWQKSVAVTAAAPKVARAPVPEPPPQAPSAPFRVLGRFVEDGVAGVFVQHNDATLVARAGDLIGEAYRLESITDQSITVVYLPMNVTQTIPSGAVN